MELHMLRHRAADQLLNVAAVVEVLTHQEHKAAATCSSESVAVETIGHHVKHPGSAGWWCRWYDKVQ